MRIKTLIVTLAAVAAALLPASSVAALVDTGSAGRCEEDMPCWDCETMGNKICGPLDSEWNAANQL